MAVEGGRIPDSAKLEKTSVLILTHKVQLARGDAEAVRSFVDQGGGLLVTGYGWVYAMYDVNKGQPVSGAAAEKILDQYPINLVMRQFGARWTNEVARFPLKQ